MEYGQKPEKEFKGLPDVMQYVYAAQKMFSALNSLEGLAPFPKPKRYKHYGKRLKKAAVKSK